MIKINNLIKEYKMGRRGKCVALIDTLLISGLTLVSLIIPLIKIRNIKPVKIIKTKE